jgi:predicted lipoprotein with Yx(FWY)xxD motif
VAAVTECVAARLNAMRRIVLVLCLLTSGCGGATAAMRTASADTVNGQRGVTVRIVRSQYGAILGDRPGQAFYVFGGDGRSASHCYGRCARAWPPVLTPGRPSAGSGTRARLLGTTRRRDGRLQVTYAGRPLYYYAGDAPGRVLCQDVVEFGGRWQVVRSSGRPVA